tara:strand:+ start:95 stop:616 length:522 start_codon:yes stop_codon:yes gene_type:complete
MKVIDNFIDEEEFNKLSEFMSGKHMDWYSAEGVNFLGDGHMQFSHVMYEHGFPREKVAMVNAIVDKLNPFLILRIKANLVLKTEEHVIHGMHTDLPEELDFKWLTGVYYVNTNNGYTLFENGEKVNSVANRMVIFNGREKHSSVTQTDTFRRFVINFNFIENLPEEVLEKYKY